MVSEALERHARRNVLIHRLLQRRYLSAVTMCVWLICTVNSLVPLNEHAAAVVQSWPAVQWMLGNIAAASELSPSLLVEGVDFLLPQLS